MNVGALREILRVAVEHHMLDDTAEVLVYCAGDKDRERVIEAFELRITGSASNTAPMDAPVCTVLLVTE